jgi:hypothetical protein
VQGTVGESPEEAFRRGYEHAAIEMFHAVRRFLEPAAREILQTWVEDDLYVWRLNSMCGYPPTWRLRMLAGSGLPGGISDLSAPNPPPPRASLPAPPGLHLEPIGRAAGAMRVLPLLTMPSRCGFCTLSRRLIVLRPISRTADFENTYSPHRQPRKRPKRNVDPSRRP